MHNSSQYFLPIEKFEAILKDLIQEGRYQKEAGDRKLKGFILTPGMDDYDNKPWLFVFPVYTAPGKSIKEEAVIIQNLNIRYAPCPYPPPCINIESTTNTMSS